MQESRATLRIFSDVPSLENVTRHLGISPDGGHSIGDRISSGSNRRCENTLWKLKSALSESEPLDRHIKDLITKFSAIKEKADMLDNVSYDIFCFFSSDNGQGSIVLDPDISRQLSDAGLALVIDIYCSADD